MKKCPPGVICIENISFFYIFTSILIIGFLLWWSFSTSSFAKNNQSYKIYNTSQPNFPYNNVEILSQDTSDVLLDPYEPPLRDERYINNDSLIIGGNGSIQVNTIPITLSKNKGYGNGYGHIPINIPGNPNTIVDAEFRQVGILKPPGEINVNKGASILPLLGRPIDNRRDVWQYYTISNQHNNVKLPIIYRGKNAMNEYGVDKIFGKDENVLIEGIGEKYKATLYENDTIRYLPFV
jgi:hypothetical protein